MPRWSLWTVGGLAWVMSVGASGCEPVASNGGVEIVDSDRANTVADERGVALPVPNPTLAVPAAASTISHRLVVKFADSTAMRSVAGKLHASPAYDRRSLDAVSRAHDLQFAPAIAADPSLLEGLRARAEARSGRSQPDLEALVEVRALHSSAQDLVAIGTELAAVPGIERVWLEPLGVPPPADIDPPTPDYVDLQGYRVAPAGIRADVAADLGYTGAGVRVADVEYGWDPEHEEFNAIDLHAEPGQTVAAAAIDLGFAPDHGTSSVAILVADAGAYGVHGMTPDAELHTFPEWSEEEGLRRTTAIANAIATLDTGDVLMLEMQSVDTGTGAYGPAELEETVWILSRMASDIGIVVVAAAGNGSLDLDSPGLAAYRARGDSGAILVGAADPETHTPESFSTFGSRVNLQGWGSDVFTAGYGYFAVHGDDPHQSYTATFAGTSSATPIVTAAVVLVQQAAKEAGPPLAPLQLREVLRATGTPQASGNHVGPLPNVADAIAVAGSPDRTAPAVAFVLPSNDVEVEQTVYETDLEITAVDDSGYIRRVEVAINGEVQPIVDEEPPFAFHSVKFPAGTWQVVARAEDLWGNIGESSPLTIAVGVMPPVQASESGDPSGSSSTGGTEGGTAAASETGATGGSSEAPPEQSGGGEDGCGCAHSGRSGPGAWLWSLFALGVARRRTRGRLGPDGSPRTRSRPSRRARQTPGGRLRVALGGFGGCVPGRRRPVLWRSRFGGLDRRAEHDLR